MQLGECIGMQIPYGINDKLKAKYERCLLLFAVLYVTEKNPADVKR